MDKITLLNKASEIILKSNIRDFSSDYESSNKVIRFKDDTGMECRISFNYRLFGAISYLTLQRDWLTVLDYRITKNEYKKLVTDIKNRESEVKQSELSKVFKDVNRDKKINEVI